MIEKIVSYLKDKGVVHGDIIIESIQGGAGGAKLYLLKDDNLDKSYKNVGNYNDYNYVYGNSDRNNNRNYVSDSNYKNEYILKSYHSSYNTNSTEAAQIKSSYQRELKFYEYFLSTCNETKLFFPRIKYLEDSKEYGTIVLMERLSMIPHSTWTKELLTSAIDKIAYFHSLTPAISEQFHIHDSKISVSEAEIRNSYEDWMEVLNQHPNKFETEYLNKICKDIVEIEGIIHLEPRFVCHGDFHPENVLSNGVELFICDWQGVNIGKVIGDISFFISRGKEMRIPMDEEFIIDCYCKARNKYAISVDTNLLYKELYASNILTTYLFWSFYLHNSSYERVSGQYDSMVDNYKKLKTLILDKQ